jgi:hypothetical protein
VGSQKVGSGIGCSARRWTDRRSFSASSAFAPGDSVSELATQLGERALGSNELALELAVSKRARLALYRFGSAWRVMGGSLTRRPVTVRCSCGKCMI